MATSSFAQKNARKAGSSKRPQKHGFTILPLEIKQIIWTIVSDDHRHRVDDVPTDLNQLFACGRVNSEWQSFFEGEIYHTLIISGEDVLKLADLNLRLAARVRHLWLRFEDPEYDCQGCRQQATYIFEAESKLAIKRQEMNTHIDKLYVVLSSWTMVNPGLTLELSVHSPSDSKHHFKNRSFRTVHYRKGDRLDEGLEDSKYLARRPVYQNDDFHGWHSGAMRWEATQPPVYTEPIDGISLSEEDDDPDPDDPPVPDLLLRNHELVDEDQRLLGLGFEADERLPRIVTEMLARRTLMGTGRRPKYMDMYHQLAEGTTSFLLTAPCVKNVLTRRQYHRAISREVLEKVLRSSPGLHELRLEMWRDPNGAEDRLDDGLSKAFGSQRPSLKRLSIFEDFDRAVNGDILTGEVAADSRQSPSPLLATVISTTLFCGLQHLSIAFALPGEWVIWALMHHQTREEDYPSWGGLKHMTTLSLTSPLLSREGSPESRSAVLQWAALLLKKMPKLRTLEIWWANRGEAAVFRYEVPRGTSRSSTLTFLASEDVQLPAAVVGKWRRAALERTGWGLVVMQGLVPAPAHYHGEALGYLKLKDEMLHPLSAYQLESEADNPEWYD